jgi:thiamine-phosphate diphosphorylase
VLGLGSVVGLSVSDERELAAVDSLPLNSPSRPDYLGLSPIRATPTKRDAAPAIGQDGASRLASATNLPCVGIGGLGADDCGWMRSAGLAGIAVVTAVLHAEDPEAATRELAVAWQRGRVDAR